MFIFDTNALSELIKRRPKPVFIDYLQRYPSEAFYTSIGVADKRHPDSRAGLS